MSAVSRGTETQHETPHRSAKKGSTISATLVMANLLWGCALCGKLKSLYLYYDRKNMQELFALSNVVKPGTRLIPYPVDFTDPRLQSSYEDTFNELQSLPDEQRQVHALIEVHDLARTLGGRNSAGVHEARWHLLLPRLRSELRRWYLHSDSDKRAATVLLKKYLSDFLREDLEISQIHYDSIGACEYSNAL